MNILVLTVTSTYCAEHSKFTNLLFSHSSTYSIYQSISRYKQLCTIVSGIFQNRKRSSAALLTSIISIVLSSAETYSINLPASLRPFCLYFPCCFSLVLCTFSCLPQLQKLQGKLLNFGQLRGFEIGFRFKVV
jgi:hypothetical protein